MGVRIGELDIFILLWGCCFFVMRDVIKLKYIISAGGLFMYFSGCRIK